MNRSRADALEGFDQTTRSMTNRMMNRLTLVAPARSTRGLRLLVRPVGYRCPNSPADVKTIQILLNLNGPRFLLQSALVEDGSFGRKTATALSSFQELVMRRSDRQWVVVVRPGDATLGALCQMLPGSIGRVLISLGYLSAPRSAIALLTPHLIDTMDCYDVGTPLRQAHFLAQVGHESGELKYREEIADGSAYEGRRDLGNTRPGDGPRFKGRGLIQLTGRANYEAYGRSIGIDLTRRPEVIADDPKRCVDVAGWFWRRRGLNALADLDDLDAITRRINGGWAGFDNRARLLWRWKTLLGVG